MEKEKRKGKVKKKKEIQEELLRTYLGKATHDFS